MSDWLPGFSVEELLRLSLAVLKLEKPVEKPTQTDEAALAELEGYVKRSGYMDNYIAVIVGCGCRTTTVMFGHGGSNAMTNYLTCWFHQLSPAKRLRRLRHFQYWRNRRALLQAEEGLTNDSTD